LPVRVGATAAMTKSFGALVKVIYDFTASDLSREAFQFNIFYVTFLRLVILLCCVIVSINIDNDNAPRFRYLIFFLGLIEMSCTTVKG
jgi:hypothetical protein